MPDEEQKNSLSDAPAPRRRRLAWFLPLLVLAGVGLWFWMNRSDDSAAQANNASTVRSTLHLETFVLNLADAEQRSYLRIGIDLGLNQDAKQAEQAAPTAEVRDTILTILSQAKVDDLLTSGGKARLKQDLLRALQERMPRLGVEEVYFTEFLIQR